MEEPRKKNSIIDIYIQSLKKDNAFYKEKMETQQKEVMELNLKYEEEKKKQQLELSSLKEDLAKMVREVTQLKGENSLLTERISEYESSYVLGSGSKKLKDALGDTRRQLRETVDKYNELVDCYDAAKEQYSGACSESVALRSENADLRNDLERSRQMYQAAAKELEDNRDDMASMMKELSELRMAMEQAPKVEEGPSVSARSSLSSSSSGQTRLITSLRGQIKELTGIIEKMRSEPEKRAIEATTSLSSTRSILDSLSKNVTSILATATSDDSPSLSSIISTVAQLRVSISDLTIAVTNQAQENAQLKKSSRTVGVTSNGSVSEWMRRADTAERQLLEAKKRAEDAEQRAKEAEQHCEELQYNYQKPASMDDISKRADIAERKVVELSQRASTFERRVSDLVRRNETAEKQVQELTKSLETVQEERDSLKRLLSTANTGLQKANSELTRARISGSSSSPSLREADLERQLKAKDEELQRQLRMREVEIQQQLRAKDDEIRQMRTKNDEFQKQIKSKEDLQQQLKAKDTEISKLRSSVMKLEGELQRCQQDLEAALSKEIPPPIPPLPAEVPTVSAVDLMGELVSSQVLSEPVTDYLAPDTDSHVVEAGNSDDAIVEVLQQMIDSPENFSLDTIDDVSFPGNGVDELLYRLWI